MTQSRRPAAQVEHAERAAQIKAETKTPPRPEGRTADEGMNPVPNPDIAPSGALDTEGQRPVLERSRKVR